MFSSEKNIESLRDLLGEVRAYMGLRGERLKLDFVSKLSRLLSAVALGLIIAVVMAVILLLLSNTLVSLLKEATGSEAVAFAIVAGGYALVGVMVYIFRRRLIVRPITSFICSLLLDDEGKTPSTTPPTDGIEKQEGEL